MRHLIYSLMAMCLLAISCQKEIRTDDPNADVNGPFYLSLVSNTATSASFEGAIDLKLYEDYQEVGIIYSLNECLDAEIDSSRVKHVTTIDKDGNFSKKIVGLLHDTQYYYSGYVLLSNGLYQLGKVNMFKTNSVNFGYPVFETGLTTAQLNAKILLPEEDLMNIRFGIVVSSDSEFEFEEYTSYIEVDKEGSYSVSLSGLDMNTTYYYHLFAEQWPQLTYGPKEEFTTKGATMTLYAEEINDTYVRFAGSIPVSQLEEVPNLIYGILISKQSDLYLYSGDCEQVSLTYDIDSDGKFTYTFYGLDYYTKYYYCWYAQSGDKIQYGKVMSFVTNY